MEANSGGSSDVTLPLYFASNSLARSSARARSASSFGSVGDAYRSLRSQRTVSAPVETALATARQDRRSGSVTGRITHCWRGRIKRVSGGIDVLARAKLQDGGRAWR